MELLWEKNKNKVFTFDGSLGDQVWESEPITRFEFSKPLREDLQEMLSSNKPSAGIIFNGDAYIGTNDGFIHSPNEKIQRIPNLIVDTDLFIQNYSFENEEERNLFKKYKENGADFLLKDIEDKSLIRKFLDIDKDFNKVSDQELNVFDKYLRGYLSISGFAVQNDGYEDKLYDGHVLGINETVSGKLVNDLIVHKLYQVNEKKAGFIPFGHPSVPLKKVVIDKGILNRLETFCVDYNHLWTLEGKGVFVRDLCPRDGSGYAPAKFATDGNVTGISHGNHPWYFLDIMERGKEMKRIELDPQKTPEKLIVKERQVMGFSGMELRNFSTDNFLYNVNHEKITSMSDSGLITIQANSKTSIYDPFKDKAIDSLKGEYVFLDKSPQ